MLHKADITQRENLRQALEEQVNEYLSRGGQISVRPPGESAILDKFPLGMRNLKNQKAYEYEMRARAARFEGAGQYGANRRELCAFVAKRMREELE